MPGPQWIELMLIVWISAMAESEKWQKKEIHLIWSLSELLSVMLLVYYHMKEWTVRCAPNVSVCSMNYQWEDGCALAELRRFRLRRPLTPHWFDISIIDSKGDSDSWAAQSQLFSWLEASRTCTQVERSVGDY